MKIAKLYGFYEKNDVRMLDRYGQPILLKIGCTTAATVQKRVEEQTKGTIVSNNVIVWGQDNDKIATWYDGHKDADKDFHSFIKIRKPGVHRPDVGSEVFELSVAELEALYQDFIKINALSEQTRPVYKINLENSKAVVEKIFIEQCVPIIQKQMLCSIAERSDCVDVDFESDSLFLSNFSKKFISTINALSQNPLSEPGLDVQLWNYILEYKNKFVLGVKKAYEHQDSIDQTEINPEIYKNKIFANMGYLEEVYRCLQRYQDKKTNTPIDLNDVLSHFSNIGLKNGYRLESIVNFGCNVYAQKIGKPRLSTIEEYNKYCHDDDWLRYIKIKNILGYIDLIVFRCFVNNLYRDYQGGIYGVKENLFCKSAITDWGNEHTDKQYYYEGEELTENKEILAMLQRLDIRPYAKLNTDGTVGVWLLHITYPYCKTLFWQEYAISSKTMHVEEREDVKELYKSDNYIIYD